MSSQMSSQTGLGGRPTLARRRGERGCTKIQEHMSTKVLSSKKNLHTTTPFRLFNIVVPIYYNTLEIYKINGTLIL